MLEIIVLVLGLLCLFLLLLLFLQHKNVRCIREQLTYTNREHSTFRFYSASMDPQMKALCEEMQNPHSTDKHQRVSANAGNGRGRRGTAALLSGDPGTYDISAGFTGGAVFVYPSEQCQH